MRCRGLTAAAQVSSLSTAIAVLKEMVRPRFGSLPETRSSA